MSISKSEYHWQLSMPISFQMIPKCLNKMMYGITSLPYKAPRVPRVAKCLSARLPEWPSALSVLSLECVWSGLGLKKVCNIIGNGISHSLKEFSKNFLEYKIRIALLLTAFLETKFSNFIQARYNYIVVSETFFKFFFKVSENEIWWTSQLSF